MLHTQHVFRRLKASEGETLVKCLFLCYLISVVLGSSVHILLPVAFSGNLSHIYLMSKLGTQSENTLQLFHSEKLLITSRKKATVYSSVHSSKKFDKD